MTEQLSGRAWKRWLLACCTFCLLVPSASAAHTQIKKQQARTQFENAGRMREELNGQIASNEQRYLQEKKTLLARQEKIVTKAVIEERQKQAGKKNRELELAYFKSLHYFNGIKDYIDKHYRDAVTEFETVAKVDPNYLELPFYLARARQLAGGQFTALKPENLKLYYQGIDLYMESKFPEAVAVWKQILGSEPNNLMVLRNIEEAESRVTSMNKAQGQPTPVPTPAAVKP